MFSALLSALGAAGQPERERKCMRRMEAEG